MRAINGTGSPRQSVPLSALHQRKVALFLALENRELLLIGHGAYEQDNDLGQILKIQIDGEDGCEVIVVESLWRGEIQPRKVRGCEYLIRLT